MARLESGSAGIGLFAWPVVVPVLPLYGLVELVPEVPVVDGLELVPPVPAGCVGLLDWF